VTRYSRVNFIRIECFKIYVRAIYSLDHPKLSDTTTAPSPIQRLRDSIMTRTSYKRGDRVIVPFGGQEVEGTVRRLSTGYYEKVKGEGKKVHINGVIVMIPKIGEEVSYAFDQIRHA